MIFQEAQKPKPWEKRRFAVFERSNDKGKTTKSLLCFDLIGEMRVKTKLFVAVLTALMSAGAMAEDNPNVPEECRDPATFAQRTICSSPELIDAERTYEALTQAVRDNFSGTDDWKPLLLVSKDMAERSFCVSDECVRNWLDTRIDQWKGLLDASKVGNGEDALTALLDRNSFASDNTRVRSQTFFAQMRRICKTGGDESAAACLYASFDDAEHGSAMLDASCTRGKGAAAGLACSVLATKAEYNDDDERRNKEKMLFERGCVLGSGTACLSWGDWLMRNNLRQQAEEAYVKAVRLGASRNRLDTLDEDPEKLLLVARYQPTPSEQEYLQRCTEPYSDGEEEMLSCLQAVRDSRIGRMDHALRDLGVSKEQRGEISKKMRGLFVAVRNILTLGKSSNKESQLIAQLGADRVLNNMTRTLVRVESMDGKGLESDLAQMCSGLCSNTEQAGDYADRVDARIRDLITDRMGNNMQAKAMLEKVRLMTESHKEIVKLLVGEMGSRTVAPYAEPLLNLERKTFGQALERALDAAGLGGTGVTMIGSDEAENNSVTESSEVSEPAVLVE